MISPELLRRYHFFSKLDDAQLRSIAMISDEVMINAGDTLFEERTPANWLFFLLEGGVDLSFKSEEEYHPKQSKVFPVGEVNPEEAFGISALIEPYQYTATAMASMNSRVMKIDGNALRNLIAEDFPLGYALITQIAKTAIERLAYTRIQLAAAWS